MHPALYADLIHCITEKANWSRIQRRFKRLASNNITCCSIPILTPKKKNAPRYNTKEHKPQLDQDRDKAKSWQDIHKSFYDRCMYIKPRGNGFVIGEINLKKDKQPVFIKASDSGRDYSKQALEKQFGKFQPYDKQKNKMLDQTTQVKPKHSYQRKPLRKHPNKMAQAGLWKQYLGLRKNPLIQASMKTAKPKHPSNWHAYIMMFLATQDAMALTVMQSIRVADKSLNVTPAPKQQPKTTAK